MSQQPSPALAADPWRGASTRIRSIRQEVPEINTYELTFDDLSIGENYRFLPGQFNMLYLPGIGEAAISISSDPHHPETLLHTIRAVGNVTRALTRLNTGDQVLLRGPFGSAWPLERSCGCDLVLACGGVGLPPLRPVIYEVLRRRGDFGRVSLLYGARTPGTLLFTDEYDSWRAAGIDVQVTVDLGNDQWTGPIGVVPTLFDRLTIDPARTRVLTCGPEIMMRFVVAEGLNRGIAREDVFVSMERNMNCAVGFCGHCQLGPTFICKDGPVFSYARIEPFFHMEEF